MPPALLSRAKRIACIDVPLAARLTVALLAIGALSACAIRRSPRSDLGIPPCPPGAGAQLLEPPALECWFVAAHGRWRLMTQASHLEALVVDVAVDDLRDADAIARLFVAGERYRYSEIIVYAHRQPIADASRVRRVRWTVTTGYDALEFGFLAALHPVQPHAGARTRCRGPSGWPIKRSL